MKKRANILSFQEAKIQKFYDELDVSCLLNENDMPHELMSKLAIIANDCIFRLGMGASYPGFEKPHSYHLAILISKNLSLLKTEIEKAEKEISKHLS